MLHNLVSLLLTQQRSQVSLMWKPSGLNRVELNATRPTVKQVYVSLMTVGSCCMLFNNITADKCGRLECKRPHQRKLVMLNLYFKRSLEMKK